MVRYKDVRGGWLQRRPRIDFITVVIAMNMCAITLSLGFLVSILSVSVVRAARQPYDVRRIIQAFREPHDDLTILCAHRGLR